MFDFDLPSSTVYNRIIPKNKFYLHTLSSPNLRSLFDEQINRITWCNKISSETLDIQSDSYFKELEIFDINLNGRSFDKRLLQQIDKGVPYYIFHIVNNEDRYQAWIANKRNYNGKIKVENYSKTHWLSENEFQFSFAGSSLQTIYSSLQEQIECKRKRKIVRAEQIESCNAFMNYFRTMKMSRSYKPVLILATIQSGGSITVEQAAAFFVKFYHNRKLRGLKAEVGNCIYADEPENFKAISYNLIHNPIDALCHSGFFEYDAENQLFSFSNDIYDGLTLDEIEEIANVCHIRLTKYFKDEM